MREANQVLRVAFQGEAGAFSEEAAARLLGENIALVPRPNFETLFSAVSDGTAHFAVAPIENSLAGSVHACFDLLLETRLWIQAEIVLPIAHHLVGVPGARFEEVAQVESHPVALAQCEKFFRQHPRIKRIATEDTAGSVHDIMRRTDPSCAAIAGRRAAELYGGSILREHVEDHPENYTRFLLLGKSPAAAERADKFSLVLQLAHRPGALHAALGAFARRNINLLKIESRPLVGRPWQYRFYLDFCGSMTDSEVNSALEELAKSADEVRLLGCYPSHAARQDEFKTFRAGGLP